MEQEEPISDGGAKCANKREQNVQRPRGKRERMTAGAAGSSAQDGGHGPEDGGVGSSLQMYLEEF